jgi:hypothetical protein
MHLNVSHKAPCFLRGESHSADHRGRGHICADIVFNSIEASVYDPKKQNTIRSDGILMISRACDGFHTVRPVCFYELYLPAAGTLISQPRNPCATQEAPMFDLRPLEARGRARMISMTHVERTIDAAHGCITL